MRFFLLILLNLTFLSWVMLDWLGHRKGEAIWIAFVFVLCAAAASCVKSRWMRGSWMLFGATVITLHWQGYKMYGSPISVDNRPLIEAPLEMSGFKLPNIVVADDGSEHPLQGFVYTDWVANLSPEAFANMIEGFRQPFRLMRFKPDPHSESGLIAEHRANYAPCVIEHDFFPERRPAYVVRDLALVLGERGIVVPAKHR